MNQKATKSILERFSCFLTGNGKKNSGHKILLESLFLLRENNDFNIFSNHRIERAENFSSKNITNQEEAFQSQKKTIQQFLCLPNILFVKPNEKSKTRYEEKTVTTFQLSKQLEKTLQKKVIVKESQQDFSKVDYKLFQTESILSKYLCLKSVENVKPILETRKIRKGRITYKVPLVTSSQRQEGKAISMLIENANFRKKNESKRSGVSLNDSNSTFQKIASGENVQNKKSFNLPLLYAWQTVMSQQFTNLSDDKKLLILSSSDDFFLQKSKEMISDGLAKLKYQNDGLKNSQKERKDLLKKSIIDRNIFFMLPEKKHFLSFFRKPNVKQCLSEELLDSGNDKGASIEKKKQLHNLALQNRAYQHFRWW